jgi:hypothetical protein
MAKAAVRRARPVHGGIGQAGRPDRSRHLAPKARTRSRAVGSIENRNELAKLFDIAVVADGFTSARNPERIAAKAGFDSFYLIRTNVVSEALPAENVVGAHKGPRPRRACLLKREDRRSAHPADPPLADAAGRAHSSYACSQPMCMAHARPPQTHAV